ncbi:MAG TPA: F0F1 ATP synthase subunit A [Clostridiales bacterium]|jgi:F-type H+-transporting ATPase subunit a|nr:F0F1 ATP synthase subunit A [Clostridiales bacterium]
MSVLPGGDILLDFRVDNLWVLQIGGVEIWITRTIFNTWIIMLVLIVLALFLRFKLRRFEEIPRGLQNAMEAVVEIFDGFLRNSGGEKLMPLGKWFFAVFAFIFVSNISGVVGLRPPTADWATTFALALATFILIQVMGIKYRKTGYVKSFFEPLFIFFPLNLIGELARPVSLSFRLFGNILAGTILMALVYQLAPIIFQFGIPAVLHAYFDLFMGALQTYIFCVLSIMFIKGATE